MAPRRTVWLLTAACMFALAVLGIAAAAAPSGLGGLVLVVPWLAVIALHVLGAPLVVVLAWRRRQHLAFAVATIYFGGFLAWNAWYWAEVNELPRWFAARYAATFSPSDLALYEAVRYGTLDAAALQRLLDAGARLDYRGPDDRGLAVAAAGHDDGTVLELLLDAGLHISATDGARALHGAVRNRRDAVTTLLLAAGVDADASWADHPPPLCTAVNAGVRGNLDERAFAMASSLVAAGADPNRRCSASRTPYTAAVVQRQANTLALFLSHGARMDVTVNPTRVARELDAATRTADLPLLALLLDAGAPAADALGQALARRQVDVVRVLLEHGVDAAARPYLNGVVYDESMHALHALLLAHGADPTLTDARGRDALARVAPRAGRALLAELVAAGADPDASRIDDVPLLIARLTPVPAEREFPFHLLALGADANVSTADGMTALLLASRMQDVDALRRLVAAGADVSAADERGRNALHHALDTADNGETVAALLELGVPAERRAADGETPACLAQRRRRRKALAAFAAADIVARACEVGVHADNRRDAVAPSVNARPPAGRVRIP